MSRHDTEAFKACARWLSECIRLGWNKSDLDALEAIWWKYHPKPGAPEGKSNEDN
jgi:hypothetical protein